MVSACHSVSAISSLTRYWVYIATREEITHESHNNTFATSMMIAKECVRCRDVFAAIAKNALYSMYSYIYFFDSPAITTDQYPGYVLLVLNQFVSLLQRISRRNGLFVL